jgi:hypothetical protein
MEAVASALQTKQEETRLTPGQLPDLNFEPTPVVQASQEKYDAV